MEKEQEERSAFGFHKPNGFWGGFANYSGGGMQGWWGASPLQGPAFQETTAANNSSGNMESEEITAGNLWTNTEDSYALVIGAGDYPGFSSDLSGVAYDVDDVDAFLANDSVWSGTETVNLENQNATKTNILSALSELNSEVTSGDDVLFYYSGHGASDGDLVCCDTSELSVEELYESLTAIGNTVGESGHVTVVLDSCYSGALVDYFSAHCTNSSEYTILTACSNSQYSYDIGTNGLFTNYLIDQALTGMAADANKDNSITVQEVYNYLTSSAYANYDTVQLYGSGNYVLG